MEVVVVELGGSDREADRRHEGGPRAWLEACKAPEEQVLIARAA